MKNVDRLLRNALDWMGDNGGGSYVAAIHDRLSALEAEVAHARERALDDVLAESLRLKGEISTRISGDDQDAMLGSLDTLEERIRALKSKPAQEVSPNATGEADQPLPCGPVEAATDHSACPENCARPPGHPGQHVVEMASEENGLLPKRRRREHEYGEEKRSHFGSFTAWCVRSGCEAYRVKNRTKTRTSFMQSPHARPTAEPGPCEVKP